MVDEPAGNIKLLPILVTARALIYSIIATC